MLTTASSTRRGGPDDRREVARDPGHGAKPPGLSGRAMTPPAPVLPDPEVAWLQQVLEDVCFCLERGNWQAALAATRAVLIRGPSNYGAAHDHRE